MKKSLIALFILVIPVLLFSQTVKPRVGIFDSRMIAVAYYQGEEGQKETKALMSEIEKAKNANDNETLMKLQEKARLIQKIANDQGLGRGSIASILEKYRKELGEIVKKEKLSCIVSKWEIFTSGKEIDYVEITEKILEIFKPNDKVKELIKELAKQKPIENAFFLEPKK